MVVVGGGGGGKDVMQIAESRTRSGRCGIVFGALGTQDWWTTIELRRGDKS